MSIKSHRMTKGDFVLDEQKKIKLQLREIKEHVRDLMLPNAFIYWSDFMFHVILGWISFLLCLKAEFFSIFYWVFFFVATFSFYRAVIFIHELAHLKKNTFFLFRVFWNFLCGFPLMVPSFLYQGIHNDHHNINLYGTQRDAEYFPFVSKGRLKIILFVVVSLFLPIFFFIRFVFFTPLSYCHKKIRALVLEKASSLAINLNHKRTLSSLSLAPMWRAQEILACLYGWGFMLLLIGDILPYRAVVLWLLILGMVFFINSLRTLAAHCYRHSDNKVLDMSEQVLDSVNITESFFGILWAPVGLRYHATHHLIPEMPYHSLGKTNRRLLRKFSNENIYIQTGSRGLFSALMRLWRESGSCG